MIFEILKLLHVLLASFWLGAILKDLLHPIFLHGSFEETKQLIIKQEKTAGMLGTISGVGTLMSGGILLFMIGFTDNPWALNAGIIIGLLMAFVGAFGIGGSYHKIIKAFDNNVSKVELRSLGGLLRKWGVVHLILWISAFFLMGLRNYI